MKNECVDGAEKYGSASKYWEVYHAVSSTLRTMEIYGSDKFISECVDRVMTDAGENWNDSDVCIAIKNTLNELIEKM